MPMSSTCTPLSSTNCSTGAHSIPPPTPTPSPVPSPALAAAAPVAPEPSTSTRSTSSSSSPPMGTPRAAAEAARTAAASASGGPRGALSGPRSLFVYLALAISLALNAACLEHVLGGARLLPLLGFQGTPGTPPERPGCAREPWASRLPQLMPSSPSCPPPTSWLP